MATAKATPMNPPDCPAITSAPGPPVGGQLYRYHASANLVLLVGVVGGIIGSCWGFAPGVIGFLAGAFPTLLVTAWAHAVYDV